MKKGSADMWWIIIGAVIAIVVMIVLIVIFSDTTGKAKGGLLDCTSKGGDCIPEENCKSKEGKVSIVFSCEEPPNTKCCFTG